MSSIVKIKRFCISVKNGFFSQVSAIIWLCFDFLELAIETLKSLLMSCTFICLSVYLIIDITDIPFFDYSNFFFFKSIGHCDWLRHAVWICVHEKREGPAEVLGKFLFCLHKVPEIYLNTVVQECQL